MNIKNEDLLVNDVSYWSKEIFDNVSEIVYVKDKDGRFITANQRFIEMINLKEDDIFGKTIFDFYDKDLAEEISLADKQVIKEKKSLKRQYSIPIVDDKIVVYSIEKTPLFDNEGNVTAIIGIGSDITSNLELEKSLLESRKHQKAILDNMPFMAWLKDKDSRFLYINEPFTKIINAPLGQAIGKTDLDFFPRKEADGYRQDDFEVMASGKKKNVEEKIKQVNGSLRWFETYKMPLFDADGEVIGTTGFARDITERKEIEILKNHFLSIVSHELRTPLTAIRGSLGLISSGALDSNPEKMKELVSIADKNCSRLINIINDILDIEKIKNGKMQFSPRRYNIAHLLKESVELNFPFVNEYKMKLNLKTQEQEAHINVDRERFNQVVSNLLSNAVKFSEPGSVIDIYYKISESTARVCVQDYGSGISLDQRERLFKDFIQGDSSDSRSKGGMGIGLNLSKSLVEKMGGKINFFSEPGEGSTFFFDFPLD